MQVRVLGPLVVVDERVEAAIPEDMLDDRGQELGRVRYPFLPQVIARHESSADERAHEDESIADLSVLAAERAEWAVRKRRARS